MKLRLSGPTVRLRLNEDDLAQLRSTARVEAVLEVGAAKESSWRYALVASPQAEALSLTLSGDGLIIVVPAAEAMAWAVSDGIGLYGEAEGVRVKIEKDLGCDHEAGSVPPGGEG